MIDSSSTTLTFVDNTLVIYFFCIFGVKSTPLTKKQIQDVMKIALAQVASEKGNVAANIETHVKSIHEAIDAGADFIVFPELSLTGYEPTLASSTAMDTADDRFQIFQQLSDSNDIMIGVGAPLRCNNGVTISMLIFRPRQAVRIYSKKYLHEDELPYFLAGENFPDLNVCGHHAALAVCYEISVAAHEAESFQIMPDLYIASVVKSEKSITAAHERLQSISQKYQLPVLMVNAVGFADGGECAGRSAVWDRGKLVAELDSKSPGVLVYDLKQKALGTRHN